MLQGDKRILNQCYQDSQIGQSFGEMYFQQTFEQFFSCDQFTQQQDYASVKIIKLNVDIFKGIQLTFDLNIFNSNTFPYYVYYKLLLENNVFVQMKDVFLYNCRQIQFVLPDQNRIIIQQYYQSPHEIQYLKKTSFYLFQMDTNFLCQKMFFDYSNCLEQMSKDQLKMKINQCLLSTKLYIFFKLCIFCQNQGPMASQRIECFQIAYSSFYIQDPYIQAQLYFHFNESKNRFVLINNFKLHYSKSVSQSEIDSYLMSYDPVVSQSINFLLSSKDLKILFDPDFTKEQTQFLDSFQGKFKQLLTGICPSLAQQQQGVYLDQMKQVSSQIILPKQLIDNFDFTNEKFLKIENIMDVLGIKLSDGQKEQLQKQIDQFKYYKGIVSFVNYLQPKRRLMKELMLIEEQGNQR